MKERLLVSFSGGETSAYMAKWLIDNKADEYEMVFVFANTGEENEETLNFANRCDKEWGLNLVWIEAKVNPKKGKGVRHKIVNYKSASRNSEPFEEIIKKYGVPNISRPLCSSRLKELPIHSYIKNELGWKKGYKTAIGIRADEFDRMNENYKQHNLIYPLIRYNPMTKQKINYWWSNQSFRLNLSSYKGNCKTCWKKSFRNLCAIAKENPEHFDFFKRMESEYGDTFFRERNSVDDIFKMADKWRGITHDNNADLNYQIDLFDMIEDMESCDIFSNCGDV
jgi:hypothetical protein